MRPLDRIGSIKLKLGIVIVAAVAGTTLAVTLGVEAGLGWLWSSVLAIVIGLIAIQFLARGMTSPLREMVRAAHEMARGDYSRRVTATSRDEVGELARAFNKMAADLAEVEGLRKDLIANVSHELRTPITALQAVLENLVEGVTPPNRTSLETMLAQVHRLSRLVAELLDLSKLESGSAPLATERFAVKPLLEQAVREADFHANGAFGRRVTLELSVEPEELTATGDAARIHQVVSNLIDNAVRYSPDWSIVRVQATTAANAVVIDVVDSGPGIPTDERERVFERFYRGDRSRSTSSGSFGLGLAIARSIVDLHGGTITPSENVPQGCRMSVRLPHTVR